jgi:hypothetical protein
VIYNQVGPGARKRHSNSAADSPRASGYKRHFTFEKVLFHHSQETIASNSMISPNRSYETHMHYTDSHLYSSQQKQGIVQFRHGIKKIILAQ